MLQFNETDTYMVISVQLPALQVSSVAFCDHFGYISNVFSCSPPPILTVVPTTDVSVVGLAEKNSGFVK